jgi:hypothetical protein
MSAYIDRRLARKIEAAGDARPVEAVIVVKESQDSLLPEDGGLAQKVVEGAVERTGELPGAARYFPRANAAVITASGRLIQEILKDENVTVASAADVDFIVFD